MNAGLYLQFGTSRCEGRARGRMIGTPVTLRRIEGQHFQVVLPSAGAVKRLIAEHCR